VNVVIDATVALKWVLDEPGKDEAAGLVHYEDLRDDLEVVEPEEG
jgi:hypothetical protein